MTTEKTLEKFMYVRGLSLGQDIEVHTEKGIKKFELIRRGRQNVSVKDKETGKIQLVDITDIVPG